MPRYLLVLDEAALVASKDVRQKIHPNQRQSLLDGQNSRPMLNEPVMALNEIEWLGFHQQSSPSDSIQQCNGR